MNRKPLLVRSSILIHEKSRWRKYFPVIVSSSQAVPEIIKVLQTNLIQGQLHNFVIPESLKVVQIKLILRDLHNFNPVYKFNMKKGGCALTVIFR